MFSSVHFLFHYRYITPIIYPSFYLLKGDYTAHSTLIISELIRKAFMAFMILKGGADNSYAALKHPNRVPKNLPATLN